MKSLRINLDALGMCASTLCMIHCLAFPLLLTVLPLLSLSSEDESSTAADGTSSQAIASTLPADVCEDECCPDETHAAASQAGSDRPACCATPTDFWIHVGLFAAVAPLGLVAWGMGYRRHRRLGVLCLGLGGVMLLAGALMFGTQLFGGRGEPVMTVLGSICMVSAHLWNRRQCRCCRTSNPAGLIEIEGTSPESHAAPLSTEGAS